MIAEKKGQARKHGSVQLARGFRTGFLRGFSNALNISPSRHEDLKFTYQGHDIAGLTPQDALSQDWNLVAAHIASIVQGEHENDESGRE